MEIIMKKYDLCVVGGGLTGVAAAVVAARRGLSVLLVERSGCLGGAMANCLVYPFMQYFTETENGPKFLVDGIFTEMRAKSKTVKGFGTTYKFDTEDFKFALDDMVIEAGVDVLFHATLFEVVKNERNIEKIRLAVKSGVMEIEADFFIDASGDGDLFTFAGCEYQLGREADGLCQPMTTCFRMTNVDVEKFVEDKPRLQARYKEEKAAGNIKNPREDLLIFLTPIDNALHFNTTRIVKHDPTDPIAVSKAEMTARAQIREMVDFLKANSEAFAKATISDIAADIGVRESRKLVGEHVLTVEELKACTKFEDAIALGNYDVDIHNPEGAGTSHYMFAPGEYYSIPYRSLLPKELDNLLVAGRCLSATHEAQASVRIMPICTALGEAAGVTAAVAKSTGKNTHTVDIATVREELRRNGAAID